MFTINCAVLHISYEKCIVYFYVYFYSTEEKETIDIVWFCIVHYSSGHMDDVKPLF